METMMAAGNEQDLVGHLTELRKRLMWVIGIVLLGFLASWSFSEQIFDFIRSPIAPFLATDSGGLVFTAPMDKFMAHIKVSLLSGVIVTAPLWIHQIWKFISPGLYDNEKLMGVLFIFFGTLLFLTGVAFVFFVVLPTAFNFLLSFGGLTDTAMITIKEYLSFFITVTLVFGLAFEMPLILTVLGIMGVIDHKFLSSKRRYAIVILAALSAVATPPDVVSMILMMLPMVGLYEISIIMVRLFGAKKNASAV